MRYVDRNGEPLNSLRWTKLYHDPRYAVIRRSRCCQREIITSWVGVIGEGEKIPHPFVVQTREFARILGKEERKEIDEAWYETEPLALAAHDKLEVEWLHRS